MADLTIALAGNPNAGKSTLFNALTGLHQHTGNWPGKTVEKKSGKRYVDGLTIEFVDLPGTYSLAAYSPDELVARNYIVDEHPDAVICVVDATNLERNLYLVVQLLELDVPVVTALNMTDQAKAQGIEVDCRRLSILLGGVPVIPTVASRGWGIDQLLETSLSYIRERHSNKPETPVSMKPEGACRCDCPQKTSFQVDYGREIETAIQQLATASTANNLPQNGYCRRWMAMKLLEGEDDIVATVAAWPGGQPVIETALAKAAGLESLFEDEVDIITADHRYNKVGEISRQVLHHTGERRIALGERIDTLVTNRLVGLPIYLIIMFVIFRLVIDVSAPYLEWVDAVINGPIAGGLSALLTGLGAAGWLHSLVNDGIVAGVGGILTFIPGLIVLFFFLALLEDSGYMARAAFVMDRLMRAIGLHGKSVIPLMLGFGCAVPAIYATRTIAGRRDRLLTALLIPFMSCSARLPVYAVFAMAFFGAKAGTVIWLMYVLGVVVAIFVGFIFSRTLLRPDAGSAFVLELPPYRMPTLKGLSIHTWQNTREFVQKAGTVILAISIILWFLLNLPWGVTDQRESFYGRASATVAPILEPLGFSSYENAGALITGFIAKELVVSTLAQVYTETGEEIVAESAEGADGLLSNITVIVGGFGQASLDAMRTLLSLVPGVNLLSQEQASEDTTLSQALRGHFSTLSALSFLVFILLYVPCVATIGAIKQEFGGRWAASAAIYQTVIAWLAAVLLFQGGRLLGLG